MPVRPWLPGLRLGPEAAALRDEARAFYREVMAPDRVEGHRDRSDLTGWDEDFEREVLARAGAEGLLGVSLPVEFGGAGRPRSHQAIVTFEAAYHDAPLIDTAAALVAPSVVAFGTAAQQAQFVTAAVAGRVTACIAYTEAGAGSDLANIATTAVSDGDGFVLDGEKVLVTGAHKADWCCTIARTEAGSRGRDGLSMFLVDLRATSGIAVERVPTANGWTLTTLRFDGTRVGPGALLGSPGGGWRQLGAALLEERSGAAWLGWATRNLEALLVHCAGTTDGCVRDALAELTARLFVALRLAERVLALQDTGAPCVAEAAASKVVATELLARIARVGAAALGPAVAVQPGWFGDESLAGWYAYEVVERLHPMLSVGANELQRSTIARAGLGLPADV